MLSVPFPVFIHRYVTLDVEQFLAKESQWQDCYKFLRNLIFNETELEENYKWMHPCYTINNKNAVLIHGFKGYVALLFQKGAILEEKYHTLIQQTERLQAEAVP